MRGKRRDGTPALNEEWGMDFCGSYASPFILEAVASIVLFEKFRGVQLVF
jgi:hypothetical protein